MNILVLTRNAWDNTNSIGNTMSNFFANQSDVEFANIYFRSSMPNNNICSRYFHVTERDIIRYWFSSSECGRAFEYKKTLINKTSTSNEKKLISFIHKFNLKWMYTLSDKLWDSKKWINKKLDDFVDTFKPDMVFTFVKSDPQYYHSVKYLHEKYNIKVGVWIADDEYTRLNYGKRKRDKERIERLKYIINAADVVWGCSEEICNYYNGIFGCNASPLYKRCSFDYPVRNAVNNPIRITYAGNLLYGRQDMLRSVIDKLSEINSEQQRAVLDIYSGTPLSKNDISILDVPGVSCFHGLKPYSEIQRIMSESDIVLHIESFDEQEILKTRYSFSTKIIDCLQSGSVLLAIGPSEVSSIKYIKKIPGAYIIDEKDAVCKEISAIIEDSKNYSKRANSIREFAAQNHSFKDKWLEVYRREESFIG